MISVSRILGFSSMILAALGTAANTSVPVANAQEPDIDWVLELADCDTVGLLQIELENANSSELFASILATESGLSRDVMTDHFAKVDQFTDNLVAAGADQLVAIFQLGQRRQVLAFRCADPGQTNAVSRIIAAEKQLLPISMLQRPVIAGSVVLCGPESIVDRLVNRPSWEPGLQETGRFRAAFDSTDQPPIKLAFSLSSNQRKAYLQFRQSEIVRELEWASVGLGTMASESQIHLAMQWSIPGGQFAPSESTWESVVGDLDWGSLLRQAVFEFSEGRMSTTLSGPAANQGLDTVYQLWRQTATNGFHHQRLRSIVSAMHKYADKNDTMPAYANFDDEGQALLSWRVHLLPFLGYEELYRQFRLNEPWDSPHNRSLIKNIPREYQSFESDLPTGKTTILSPLGEFSVIAARGVPVSEITDGTVLTIAVVDAAPGAAVDWTRPEDLRYDPEDPAIDLVASGQSGFYAATADAGVHFISGNASDAMIRQLFHRSDNGPYGFARLDHPFHGDYPTALPDFWFDELIPRFFLISGLAQ